MCILIQHALMWTQKYLKYPNPGTHLSEVGDFLFEISVQSTSKTSLTNFVDEVQNETYWGKTRLLELQWLPKYLYQQILKTFGKNWHWIPHHAVFSLRSLYTWATSTILGHLFGRIFPSPYSTFSSLAEEDGVLEVEQSGWKCHDHHRSARVRGHSS